MTDSLKPEIFLNLVDEVLTAAGRRPLEDANKRIVSVLKDDRVLQILAGPGSGKTEMLVWRVLHDVIVHGTPSRRILVTTFTRKAATELSVRVVERSDQLLAAANKRGIQIKDPCVHDLRVGTIHSLCDALLAEFDTQYMANGTELIDEHETVVRGARIYRNQLGYGGPGRPARTVDRLLARNELVALFRAPWDDDDHWPGNNIQRVQFILRLLAQHAETWVPRCAATGTKNGAEAVHKLVGLTDDMVKLYDRWREYLTQNQIMDFATIQGFFHDRQASLVDKLDHVFVDEFQDTNPIQFAIHTRWLDNPGLRLTVVGDDDQAMYRFRGSDAACFSALEPFCASHAIAYRRENLEKNWRSTRAIVEFSQAYKAASVLEKVSMKKRVEAGDGADVGQRVRMLRGPWAALCDIVAQEIASRMPPGGTDPATACLFFSASEKGNQRRGPSAASSLRTRLSRDMRVYNSRSKTAAREGSPVAELLALLSYLVDPVDRARIGSGGRPVDVCASDPRRATHARTVPPPFPVNSGHVAFQKRFIKGDGGTIGAPASDRRPLFDYLDAIRDELAKAKQPPRLTLAGLVARLLSFDRYRGAGYSVSLFRQALFTELLEANVAPSRRTMTPLDAPLRVRVQKRKYVWPSEYWTFLSTFGALLSETDLDDPDVEAFENGAVALMTFHQSKGLEFDHVYIAGTGRDVAHHSVLQTMLFSGKTPKYKLAGPQPVSSDTQVKALAEADRARELYVAMTRAKRTLTFLFDPQDTHPLMRLDPVLENLAQLGRVSRMRSNRAVEVVEFSK